MKYSRRADRPVGTFENSPAIHRWEKCCVNIISPVGTIEPLAIRASIVPTGLKKFIDSSNPAMNRWAIVDRPYGTERAGLGEVGHSWRAQR
jgi:hypothetical protein